MCVCVCFFFFFFFFFDCMSSSPISCELVDERITIHCIFILFLIHACLNQSSFNFIIKILFRNKAMMLKRRMNQTRELMIQLCLAGL